MENPDMIRMCSTKAPARRRRGLHAAPPPGLAVVRRARQAFTLIELLVVIAVISILAAMLMPAVINAMKTADAANCTSNLKQIAAAMLNYANAHDGFMAPLNTAAPSLEWDPPKKWWQLLEPFSRELGIFRCPAKKRTQIGYSMNHRVFTPPRSKLSHLNLWVGPQQLTVCNNPSATILFLDVGWVTNIADAPREWNEDDRNPGCARMPIDMNHGAHDGKKEYVWWETSPTRPVPRHPADKTNCSFFDGHVDGIVTREIADDDYFDPGCLYDNQ